MKIGSELLLLHEHCKVRFGRMKTRVGGSEGGGGGGDRRAGDDSDGAIVNKRGVQW